MSLDRNISLRHKYVYLKKGGSYDSRSHRYLCSGHRSWPLDDFGHALAGDESAEH